ncbi:MAG: citrate/2-methylcitrate synthase [Acidimicrobiales bacterium]
MDVAAARCVATGCRRGRSRPSRAADGRRRDRRRQRPGWRTPWSASGWACWRSATTNGGSLLDRSPEEIDDDALRLAAVVPTILARHHRVSRGEAPIEPDAELSHAADYLRMCTGAVPAADAAHAVEQYLVATVDHGFSASTFTGRVVASTGADMAGALVAAIGADRTAARRRPAGASR